MTLPPTFDSDEAPAGVALMAAPMTVPNEASQTLAGSRLAPPRLSPTVPLYRIEPYLQETMARVIGHTAEGGIVADVSIFCPAGGGQPGDSGWLIWQGGRVPLATSIRTPEGGVALVASAPAAMPPVGAEIRQCLDWGRRYRHMRLHTALHLLSALLERPVNSTQIGADRGRLDCDMAEPPEDLMALEEALNALIERDFKVWEEWVPDAAWPEAGSRDSLSVRARMRAQHRGRGALAQGQGRLRLIRIGDADELVDLQACGGTHVARTAEIGRVLVEKIEKKGRLNCRISIALQD